MRFSKLTLILILLVALCSPSSFARKKDKPKIVTGPAKIHDVKFNLVPFLNLGVVVGEAADAIETWGGDNPDKMLYGGGLSFVYYPVNKFGLALNIARQFKPLPGEDIPSGHGWFYSSSFIYNLRPLNKAFPYARLDAGFLTASYPRTGTDLDLGTYSYMRLGVGLFVYSSGKINMRYELYYQRAFSEGSTIDALGDMDVDFMAECIAFEVGIGIPLSLR